MDGQQTQVSDEEPKVLREEPRRRRRKKAITSTSGSCMDQISVEFILPTVVRGGSSPDSLLLEVAGNWTRFSPDHCILLYQKKGNVCEIYDKHQVFQTLDCIRYWRALKKEVGRIQLLPRPQPSDESLQYQRYLNYLIAYDVTDVSNVHDDDGVHPQEAADAAAHRAV
ncbi:hypothetical protein F7725_021811 [Dissostichus mawsoni]|uniref:PIK3 catalytic subunit gamma adaptor-binding domain-containing protein n=1 Tax=Dissostichus mawsoni TaxID=36200 RepID=A0A7J5ZCA1_DISMA|nr:hypothetical protein F7725_021811 [Dissostichus mawsoni]